MLNLLRVITSTIRIPGRFLFVDTLINFLYPSHSTITGQVGNIKMRFDLQDTLQRRMFFGIYDEREVNVMRERLSQKATFFDIGANIGYYSLIASQIVGVDGAVHAFEPVEKNTRILRNTIEINGIKNIRLNQVAVGRQAGDIDLFVPENVDNSGWVSILNLRASNKITVRVICLDDYVTENSIERVDLMKVDVEGAECQVLDGGAKLFDKLDAPDLIIEVNPYLLERQKLTSHSITDRLSTWGYSMYFISKRMNRVRPETTITRLENLFCTKDK